MKRRKMTNLVVFAISAFVVIVALRLWDLYVIARVPPPRPPASTSDAAKRLEADVRSFYDLGIRDYAHPAALESAGERVRDEWTRLGYAVRVQRYPVRPPNGAMVQMDNLIAVLPAASPGAPVLVIGAHYDTAPNTAGADDNASGVAGLLELTRRLKGRAFPFEIRFVAYSTEEPPFFGSDQMGSVVHARSLDSETVRVRGMICLEMLGYFSGAKGSQTYPQPLSLFYPDRAEFIGLVSNLHSRGFLKELAAGFRPARTLPVISAALPGWIGEIGLSDQRNYWARGWPAVMVTDTSFLRYPHYHQPTDTPERLDYEKMADVIDALAASIGNLKDLPR